jgi:hypothetical protein
LPSPVVTLTTPAPVLLTVKCSIPEKCTPARLDPLWVPEYPVASVPVKFWVVSAELVVTFTTSRSLPVPPSTVSAEMAKNMTMVSSPPPVSMMSSPCCAPPVPENAVIWSLPDPVFSFRISMPEIEPVPR